MEPRTQGHLEGPLLREKAQAVGTRPALGNMGSCAPPFPGPEVPLGRARDPSHPSRHIMAGAKEKRRHRA